MAGGWTFHADTGGTFTDCLGRHPEHGERRLKVLSSSALRVRVTAVDGKHVRLTPFPDGPDGLLGGYTLRGREGGAQIVASHGETEDVVLAEAVGFEAEELVEIKSPEEAPVFGARLMFGVPLGDELPVDHFALATTRGTNALLEEKGAPVALFVTAGFGDLLAIGDQRRPALFALAIKKPKPLTARVVEVSGRLDAEGHELVPLDEAAVEAAAQEVLAAGIDVAAVAFMHSYRQPVHEEAVAAILRRVGFRYVAVSAALAPAIRMLPRAGTAVVDAYLGPLMQGYLDAVAAPLPERAELTVMTSTGGLIPRQKYRAKDALLSGPAGGAVGAAASGRRSGAHGVLAFDMGGTSTDVSRLETEVLPLRESHTVGRATLLAPALRIETVAAGGGSICGVRDGELFVGPESAGADPGPACYGRGGPLTLTDVNLLKGRLPRAARGFPLESAAAEARFAEVLEGLDASDEREAVLDGFLALANERMAEAIRRVSVGEGYDPADYALLAFGGAGGLHACGIADRLAIRRVLIPADAGLLSALGLAQAPRESSRFRQLLEPWSELAERFGDLVDEMTAAAREELKTADDTAGEEKISVHLALRLPGQEAALDLVWTAAMDVPKAFAERYAAVFGYAPEAPDPEAVSVRVVVARGAPPLPEEHFADHPPSADGCEGEGVWTRDELRGRSVAGPAVIADAFATIAVEAGWTATVGDAGTVAMTRPPIVAEQRGAELAVDQTAARKALFTHRFGAVVAEMGAQLARTAVSTNVKERHDYSCALLDAEGRLVVNAPHIPVHLGALGLCVRRVTEVLPLGPGDVAITNHPGYGGSHLPDITVITPVHTNGGALVGYLANRAHHAEIGGIQPGSMPTEATCLAEEGVVIAPRYLVRNGAVDWEGLEALFTAGAYPTRAWRENRADLRAQLAANRRGQERLEALLEAHGAETIGHYMRSIQDESRRRWEEVLAAWPDEVREARDMLDDGTVLQVALTREGGQLVLDFAGTATTQPGNLYATEAIVRSAVLYVVRLLVGEEMPLNDGLSDGCDIRLPNCFLAPTFPDDPTAAPPVAGGNVETSQRLVDLLLRAVGVVAGSQATMNNLVFGNDDFGYYETIGGGSGATRDHLGADGVHTHMTNTAITDSELLEHRYPVIVDRFALRPESGGAGAHRGGNGLERVLRFRAPVVLAMLTQRRCQGAWGLEAGGTGQPGRQTVCYPDGREEVLPACFRRELPTGAIITIATPGGGGWAPTPDKKV